jgi:hypothetical protein
MNYLTFEVDIVHGRIVAREPEKLPDRGSGLLTVLPAEAGRQTGPSAWRQRIELPLIRGDGKRIINPTPAELDASPWGD